MDSHFFLGNMQVNIRFAELLTACEIHLMLAAIYFIANPLQRKKTNFITVLLSPILGFLFCTFIHEIGHILGAKIAGMEVISLNVGMLNQVEIDDPQKYSLEAIVVYFSGGVVINLLLGISLVWFDNGYTRLLAAVNLFNAALNIWPIGVGTQLSDGFLMSWVLATVLNFHRNIAFLISCIMTVIMIGVGIYIYLLDILKTKKLQFD